MRNLSLISLFVIILLQTVSFASEGETLFEAGKFKKAIDFYEQEIASQSISADVYYNLGNSYYRNGELGKAIWGYESALKLDPDHQDALYNLEFVNAQTKDKLDVSRQGIGHWFAGILFSENINFWAYSSLFSALMFALTTFLYIKRKLLKRGWMGMICAGCFFVLLFSVTIAGYRHQQLSVKDRAVVISELVEVKLSPMDDAKVTYSLGEGAQLDIIENAAQSDSEGWMQVEVNGNPGWIEIGNVRAY